jgi:hypothetical protein
MMNTAGRGAIVLIAALAATTLAVRAQAPVTFKVATWNLRGGSGIEGYVKPAGFESSTGNCTDPARPRNAWGVGFLQPFVTKHVAGDPDVIAFGTQEGWGCARSEKVAPLLTGWKKWTWGRSGVNLFTRYGIVGEWAEFQIEKAGVGGMKEHRWLLGGNVCLVADCSRTAYIFTTHLAPAANRDWPAHVQKVLDYLATKPQPQVLMGDLNLWKDDRWSPKVRCGAATPEMTVAYHNIIKTGFVDAWAATQSGPGWTGMTSRKAPRGGVYCGEKSDGTPYKRIDYVLTKGVKPVATELFAFTGAGTPHPSDHLGLKATLVMPSR